MSHHNNIEVFYMSASDFDPDDGSTWMGERIRERLCEVCDKWDTPAEVAAILQKEQASLAGFYWWYCCAGCLSDSDAIGPFKTEAEAWAAASEED